MRDFPVCYASGLLHMLRILETLLFECPLDILSDAAALSGSSPCSFDIYTNKNSSSFEELFLLARHEGLEPPTFAFVVRDSIQLS